MSQRPATPRLRGQKSIPTIFPRRSSQRGMMVVGTLLLLLGLMSIVLLGVLSSGSGGTSSSGMMSASDNGLFAARSVGQRVIAVNLADAGVEDTILWLSAQSAAPTNTTAFAPSSAAFTLPLWNATTQAGSPPCAVVNYPDAAHTFSVTVYPSSGNSGGGLKSFLIESVGNDAGFTQMLHVYVTQVSFTHWAWFEGNGNPGGWSSNVQSFEGPTHYNTMWGTFSLNWRDGTAPIFNYTGPDAFSTGFPIYWQHNGNSVSGPPASSDTAGWGSLSLGGPTSIKSNQNQVSLPSTAPAQSIQKTAALGTLTTAPTSAIGATACPGGGIYIHGDVQQMTLSTDPFNSETQIIELYQVDPVTNADDYTKITLSAGGPVSIQTGTFTPSGTITLNPSSSWPAQVPGAMNGVIYCDGNIGSQTYPATGGLKGVIADNNIYNGTNYHTNALTIATDPTKDIYLDGSLLVNTPRQVQQNIAGQYEFHNCNGTIVTQATATPTPSGCVPVYVPESLDTGNFKTWAGELGLVTNNIVYGSFVMNSTGMQQTGSSYTPLTSMEIDAAQFEYGSNGQSQYSWADPGFALLSMGSNVHNSGTFGWHFPAYDDSGYDNRLSSLPPPYYPATSNRYTLVSWQRVTSTVP